ncbi:MAG: hypothetical protein H6608_10805 [Flavobacteriales bacterium]|nr:hypothetical protein [Bacteroidota bacterium]MCB9241616.1 hypothetical protein [Flavobacteriales bacterium]
MNFASNNEFESIKRNFFDTAVADAYRAIDGGSMMGAFILTHCLIDYGAAIYFGDIKQDKGEPGRIERWIVKFLAPINPLYGQLEIAKMIKNLRNGLLHSYGSFDSSVTEHMPLRFVSSPRVDAHLMHSPSYQGRVISLYYLLPHVTIGLWHTFESIRKRDSNKYLSDVIQVLGRTEEIKTKTYASMHAALTSLDGDTIRFELIQGFLGDMLIK